MEPYFQQFKLDAFVVKIQQSCLIVFLVLRAISLDLLEHSVGHEEFMLLVFGAELVVDIGWVGYLTLLQVETAAAHAVDNLGHDTTA